MDREIKRKIGKIIETHIADSFSYPVSVNITKVDVTYKADVQKLAGSYKTQEPTDVNPPKRKYRKRKFRRTGQYSLHRDYTTSPADIKIMRKFLSMWNKQGLLSDSIRQELLSIKNKSFMTITRTQKDNILKMFYQVRTQIKYSTDKAKHGKFQRKETALFG